ncbi:hypothetical protein IFM89_026344 [Coptis chinensis]|uniref:Uncharacterized protein n=1 Tax=Coptis chinensis TaxID=261450 RepID=A0A835LSY5_9MAGN|nr:hypothetical protein IFM89_026344 [Coptis chinensis]
MGPQRRFWREIGEIGGDFVFHNDELIGEEDSLVTPGSPLQKREKLYLLAVGNFRSGDYSRSRQLWCDRHRHCCNLTVVGLLVGGIDAALARKK